MYDEEDLDDEEAGTEVATTPDRGVWFGGTLNHLEAFSNDPSVIAWPPTLPIEVALRVAPIRQICEDYGITREQWDAIRQNPHFVNELGRAVEALRVDGMAFKARAQLQSVELLKTSWRLIHDAATPPAVKADLIKYTIRCSGLDASKDAALAQKGGSATSFSITINL